MNRSKVYLRVVKLLFHSFPPFSLITQKKALAPQGLFFFYPFLLEEVANSQIGVQFRPFLSKRIDSGSNGSKRLKSLSLNLVGGR